MTTTTERIEDAIEDRAADAGLTLTIDSWKDTEDGPTAIIEGIFQVTTPDFEHEGLYDGDIGHLEAAIGGTAAYRNERVIFSFVPAGCDSGEEVTDLSILEPTTDD